MATGAYGHRPELTPDGRRDVFVVPSWMPRRLEAVGGDAVLFSFSDRPAQQALGLWRERPA